MPFKITTTELGWSKKLKGSKTTVPETEESQDDSLSQLLGVTIAAIEHKRTLCLTISRKASWHNCKDSEYCA
ncbi:hypothetical protein BDR07DRAFT_1429191, partial [Suillus spraguei]